MNREEREILIVTATATIAALLAELSFAFWLGDRLSAKKPY